MIVEPPTRVPPPIPPPILPPAGEPPVAGAAPSLSDEHLQQLEQANLRAKKVRKAGGVAMFNGCCIAFFAGFSLLFVAVDALFGKFDLTGTVIGVGLGLVAWSEFKGRRLIRAFDLRAPRLLGWNQVCLMVLIIGYCAWMIANAYLGPNPYAVALDKDTYMVITVAVYGGVIVGSLIFQGLNAVYYFTRAKHLSAYLDETPDWVVDVQRRTAGQ